MLVQLPKPASSCASIIFNTRRVRSGSPCGNNANSSRSWVDFFENRTNRRIYGFCALGNPSNLGRIWFALPEGQLPPSYIYIEITDRQTNTKYRSNLADTTM